MKNKYPLFLLPLFLLFSPLYANDNNESETKSDRWFKGGKFKFSTSQVKDKKEYLNTDDKDSLTDYEKEQLRIQEEQLRLQKTMLFLQIMQSMPRPQYTPNPIYYRRTQLPQQPKRYNINIRPTVINSPDSPQVYEGTIEER